MNINNSDSPDLKEQISKTCEGFSESVKSALFHIFDQEHYIDNDFKWSGNVLEILVDSSNSFEEKLILSDAKYAVDKEFDSISFFLEDFSFVRENDRYKLTGEAFSYAEDVYFDMSITFASANCDIQVFNPTNLFMDLAPWDQLSAISNSIITKEIFDNLLNTAELELLPLLKEIQYLQVLYSDESKSLPNFKAYITKHNFLELLPLIERIESSNISRKRRTSLIYKLINKLNLIKYKPLWQELYDLICSTQKDYPTYIAIKKPKCTITRLRNKTTKIMQEYGYSGTYPDFYKKSALKGIHLFESYNLSYTVAFANNVVHHIHCDENLDDQNIALTFLYGTEFLKRGENVSDINSCRFNCKGKKFTSSVMFKADFESNQKLSLEERIEIITKKAEFKKLSQKEQSKIFNTYASFSAKFMLFLVTFIFSGFIFASLFIPVMMAFAAFMLWIDGMPVIISDIPWTALYFETWALFGAPMGIITASLKK